MNGATGVECSYGETGQSGCRIADWLEQSSCYFPKEANAGNDCPETRPHPARIVFTSDAARTLIILPAMEAGDCERVADDLMALYASESARCTDWMVDFTNVVHRPTLLFLGTLAALQTDLSGYGSRLLLAGVRRSLFSPRFTEQLSEVFHLRPSGSRLYSESF